MNKPWYQEGLNFKCTGCGQCCTGAPGYVFLSPDEIQAIANHLQISLEECVKKYVRKVGHKFSLNEDSKTFDCTFLKDNRCTIYPVRPKQCRQFPWWKENLSSRQAWNETAKRCEGINHKEAPLITLGAIQKELV